MPIITLSAIVTFFVPCGCAQDAAPSGQTTPAISGTGNAHHIAIWTNSTTLGSSAISSTGGNVGIGTTAPVAKLEVDGSAQVDGNFTLSGTILLSGAGTLIWVPNDGSGNFSAGLGALPTGTTGSDNTALGNNVLTANTSGVQNTASGFGALSLNTSGGGNTASGYLALNSNTTGYANTSSGSSALSRNTIGSANTAIGSGTLGFNTSGQNNTAIGSSALALNTTGQGNTALGGGALFSNVTGFNNTAIGYNAGYNITNSNNIDIGHLGSNTDSGTIRIGCTSNCLNNANQTSAYIAGIYGSMTGLAGVPVVVDSNGQLGTVSSSRRYKDNIQDMGDASDGLMKLRPVTFRYKKAYEDGSKPLQFGLIAEEVDETYPDLVARSADGQIESVRYQLLDSMLLNELQKQHATIDAQKQQIQFLEERVARVEAALSSSLAPTVGR